VFTRAHLERTVSLLFAMSTVAIAASLVHREFFGAGAKRTATAIAPPPQQVEGWRDMLRDGYLIGDTSAFVTVAEFVDIECPYCREFNRTLRELRQRYGRAMAISVIHLPLANHRFALPAARAVECAARQGRYEQMLNVLYDKQDSLGFKSWEAYGAEAGVRDTVLLRRCTSDRAPVPRIEAGVALAKRIGVNGTPTVVVNGWRYATPPSDSELTRVASELAAGRNPFASRSRW
jgi:protein-disulfide isomerase